MLKLSGQVLVTKDEVNRIFDSVKAMDGTVLSIGIHSDATPYELASQPPPAEVAARNEFGHNVDGPQVPARPFMRPAIESAKDQVGNGIVQAISGFVLTKTPLSQGFAQAASIMLRKIQHNILSNTPPPLSGSYDPPRGYLGFKRIMGYPSRTLVATYTMLRAFSFKIVNSKGTVTAQGSVSEGESA